MSAAYAGAAPCGRCGVALPPESGESVRCVCGAEVRVFRFAPFRTAASSSLPPVLGREGDTACAYHAGNAASDSCRRCGSFICNLCVLRLSSGGYCPPCFERLRSSGELQALRSRYARPHGQALALGVLSLGLPGLNVLLSPLVIWLAARALRQREELSERERFVLPKALLALGLGVLPLLLLGLLVMLFVSERP